MNYSTAIFLISDDARGVLCSYEDDGSRKLFKTLNPDIKTDDYVVVPTTTRHKMTVVKVVEVDVDPDYESATQIDWIIGVVDRATHEDLLNQEAVAVSKIKQAEKKQARDKLREGLLDVANGELKALPIYSVDAPAAPTAE